MRLVLETSIFANLTPHHSKAMLFWLRFQLRDTP